MACGSPSLRKTARKFRLKRQRLIWEEVTCGQWRFRDLLPMLSSRGCGMALNLPNRRRRGGPAFIAGRSQKLERARFRHSSGRGSQRFSAALVA